MVEIKKSKDGLKNVLEVPGGYRFISDWKEYDLEDFCFPHILDKQIPGCGYTTYCLWNQQNLILVSPRRILLENKAEQTEHVFYFKVSSSVLDIDKDLTKITKGSAKTKSLKTIEKEKEERLKQEKSMFEQLDGYIGRRITENSPIKILVTYDSFGKVRQFLTSHYPFLTGYGTGMDKFQVVVDEFQSIFIDSRFKSDTEMDLLRDLYGIKRVCFVSATPMIDTYLRELSEFKDLPYYEMDWATLDPGRTRKPDLDVLQIGIGKSVVTEAKKIIQTYLDGKFEILPSKDGFPIQSKEAVFYINSVNNIIGIIRKCGLLPDQVNILCSDTEQNQKRIRNKLGKAFKIGKVPLRGETHKMFTFCTRTVYLGADFYSTCARTFILSDANIESLAVDISLDLPQILGRQRLDENPWKNKARFYYRKLSETKKVDKNFFEEEIEKKKKDTNNLIEIFYNCDEDKRRTLLKTLSTASKVLMYRSDYVSVNPGDIGHEVVFNNLVLISERRAFDIQQIDYRDRFTIFSALKSSEDVEITKMSRFIMTLQDTKILFSKRLQLLCENEFYSEEEKKYIAEKVSDRFNKYYNILGPERLKAAGYSTDILSREISDLLVSKDSIRERILSTFKVGEKYKKSDIKPRLQEIYTELGLSKTAKAIDLEEYYELKNIKINDPTTKVRDHGYEILGIK